MNGKYTRRSNATKVLSLVLALALVMCASVAGTLAWLTAQTGEVVNTFTSAELFANPSSDFTLWEHAVEDEDSDGEYELDAKTTTTGNAYDILPGVDIPKDPTVDVKNLEEHAYLYIKVTGLDMPDGLTATIDADYWEQLTGYTDIWVYKGTEAESNVIKATDDDKKTFTVTILEGNKIEVAEGYEAPPAETKPDGSVDEDAEEITLSFEAYMVQATGTGTAAEAWAKTYGAPTTP